MENETIDLNKGVAAYCHLSSALQPVINFRSFLRRRRASLASWNSVTSLFTLCFIVYSAKGFSICQSKSSYTLIWKTKNAPLHQNMLFNGVLKIILLLEKISQQMLPLFPFYLSEKQITQICHRGHWTGPIWKRQMQHSPNETRVMPLK